MRRSFRQVAIGVCAVLVAGSARADPHTIAVDAELRGEAPLDFAGLACASGGDLNGDGLDDLLVGAEGHDGDETNQGVVYVLFDSPTGVLDLHDAPASLLGEEGMDCAGADVGIALDADGDGLDDILVGAPGKDHGGAAYLILGRPAPWSPDTSLATADASFLAEGTVDSAGSAVAGAGDVDGDGLGDLVVGAWHNGAAGVAAGAAYLILGRTSGWAMDLSLADADSRFTGESSGDYAGSDVAAAGDLNGDGLADFLIGAPYSDLGGLGSGAAYLILGSVQGWPATSDLSTSDAAFAGDGEWHSAGRAVAGAGDVDGDGLDDILVSGTGGDGGETAALFLGTPFGWAPDVALADADITFVAQEGWELADVALGGGGDVDGDGLDDILVGGVVFPDPADERRGTAVVPGEPTPAGGIRTLGWGTTLVISEGESTEVWATTTRGDLDGDGRADLVIGVRDGGSAGAALVVYGSEGEDADGDGVDIWRGDCDDSDYQVYPGAPDPCGDQLDSDCAGDLAQELDQDGDGVPPCAGDCADDDPLTHPAAPEACDGIDNDCDGLLAPEELLDLDGDGHTACGGDCDDTDPQVHPLRPEACDGIDNDCDGLLPEDEFDADGDGFLGCQDCDDDDPSAYPGANDPCGDMLDTDCGGDLARELDHDGDGFSPCQGDCHDNHPHRHPGAEEICNGVDDDCDGVLPVPEADQDGDGWAICEGDCDDGDPHINPWEYDACGDGIDDDCDGRVDE